MVKVILGLQVPTTTTTVQMKDGQLIPAGVFEGVVDPSRVGPNGAEFSGNKTLAVCCDIVCMCMCIWTCCVCMCIAIIVIIHFIVNIINCERHRGAVDTVARPARFCLLLIAFQQSPGNYITSCINCFDVVSSDRRSYLTILPLSHFSFISPVVYNSTNYFPLFLLFLLEYHIYW